MLTQEQRIEKKARKLLLPLFEVSEYAPEFREAVLLRATELLRQNGLYIASEGVNTLRKQYLELEGKRFA